MSLFQSVPVCHPPTHSSASKWWKGVGGSGNERRQKEMRMGEGWDILAPAAGRVRAAYPRIRARIETDVDFGVLTCLLDIYDRMSLMADVAFVGSRLCC